GANDIYLGRPRAESVQALEGLVRWSAGEGFAPFVVAAPPLAEADLEARSAALKDALAQICRDRGAPFLDLPEAVDDWSVWRAEAQAGDGVHPNAQGYAKVASVFAAWPPWRDWLEGPRWQMV
ncbi:MAG TPA: SGNH/GDSL hydrolase family protein, partial [Caulobacteraceae bacterium]|nr:SGNH/GDSL hydrolase family protein [Caulobacteraceae bacterium]